jgi:hypothetical protein
MSVDNRKHVNLAVWSYKTKGRNDMIGTQLICDVSDIGSDELTWIDPTTEYEYRAKLVVVKREQDPLYRGKEWLYHHYVVEGLSCSTIGNMFGISPMAIYKWLVKHDIPTRPRGGGIKRDN